MRNPLALASIEAAGTRLGERIERQFETIFRRVLHGPMVVREERFIRLVTGEPHPFGNFALLHDVRDVAAAKEAAAPLLTCGAPAAMIFPASEAGPQVAALLAELRFELHESMPAMAVDLAKLGATALPEGYDFVRIGDGPDGEAWAETFADGYEIPARVARLFAPAAEIEMSADAELQYFGIRQAGKLVSTSVLYLGDGLAGIYCVATEPAHRGRGLGAHATAEALRIAQRLGYGVGVLQSSAMGHSVYRRLGFSEFGCILLYVRATT